MAGEFRLLSHLCSRGSKVGELAQDTRTSLKTSWYLLGPAFVAAIAYVDPGNVAANVSSGAQFGYLLLWVIVAANVMAALVQYLSAKLGLVTGRSLPEAIGKRMGRPARLAYWAQAEIVAMATDVAEVIGGAIALRIMFNLPLPIGGIITGVVSLLLLTIQDRRGQRLFERVITALLLVIAIGFTASFFVVTPPPMRSSAVWHRAFREPRAFFGRGDHGGDRHAARRLPAFRSRARPARASRSGPSAAPAAARHPLGCRPGDADSRRGKRRDAAGCRAEHAGPWGHRLDRRRLPRRPRHLGATIAVLFAVGLLASGLASSSVGAYAGAMIMQGLLHWSVPMLVRRLITLGPALAILTLGFDPTRTLVLSQVVLSFGIPFAVLPLVKLTGSPAVMGGDTNHRATTWVGWVVAVMVSLLNVMLIYLTVTG